MTEPESVHALTGAYVLDALEPAELGAFEQHLAACLDCREEVRSLRSAVLRLPGMVATAPPPQLRSSVLAAISSVRPLPPLPEQQGEPAAEVVQEQPEPEPVTENHADAQVRDLAEVRQRRRPDRWRLVAAAAVVVALVSVGWGLVRPASPDPAREQASVQRVSDQQFDALLAADDLQVYGAAPSGVATGVVMRSESLGLAALVIHNLPGVDPGQEFQAWTIRDGGPVPDEVFTSSDGTATVFLGDTFSADAVAVTVEPTGGSPAPTGELLIQVPMT